MPGKKHLRGVSAKEQREYEHIKESAERPAAMVVEPKKWPLVLCLSSTKPRATGRGTKSTAIWALQALGVVALVPKGIFPPTAW